MNREERLKEIERHYCGDEKCEDCTSLAFLLAEIKRLEAVEKKHHDMLSRWGDHELRWQASQKENAELREKLIRFEGASDNALFIMEKNMLALQPKLKVAVKALSEIKSEVGTSTLAWRLANKAISEMEEEDLITVLNRAFKEKNK